MMVLYMNLYNEQNVDFIYEQMLGSSAFGSCGVTQEDKKRDIVESTLYNYDQGLRGHQLRHRVRTDCGVSIIFIIQFAMLIYQIIEWIKKLRS